MRSVTGHTPCTIWVNPNPWARNSGRKNSFLTGRTLQRNPAHMRRPSYWIGHPLLKLLHTHARTCTHTRLAGNRTNITTHHGPCETRYEPRCAFRQTALNIYEPPRCGLPPPPKSLHTFMPQERTIHRHEKERREKSSDERRKQGKRKRDRKGFGQERWGWREEWYHLTLSREILSVEWGEMTFHWSERLGWTRRR